jgi:hypothetical protein
VLGTAANLVNGTRKINIKNGAGVVSAVRKKPVELRSDRDGRGVRRAMGVAGFPDNVGKTFPNRPQHFRKNLILGDLQLPKTVVSI